MKARSTSNGRNWGGEFCLAASPASNRRRWRSGGDAWRRSGAFQRTPAALVDNVVIDGGRQLFRRHDVTALPTVVALAADGSVVAMIAAKSYDSSLDWVSGPGVDAGDAWEAARLWDHIRRYG